MNEIDDIIQKLVELGWEDNGGGLGGDLFSPDLKFIADISYLPHLGWYEVRVALTGIFDRWANSGVTRLFKDKRIVLDFFKSKAYMTAAYEEAMMLLEENLSDDSSAVEPMNRIVELMDKIIDMTIDWFNE